MKYNRSMRGAGFTITSASAHAHTYLLGTLQQSAELCQGLLQAIKNAVSNMRTNHFDSLGQHPQLIHGYHHTWKVATHWLQWE